MSIVPSCFEGIIGMSRKENVCVSDLWDSSYADSDSGLYLDELPGMPQNFIASLGGNYNIWEKFTYSLENAIRTFQIDSHAEILKYKESARKRFYGDIGGKTFTQTLATCGTYHGLRLYSDIRGGSFVLRGVTLITSVTENVTLEIYDEYNLLYTYILSSTSGVPKKTIINPLELDLDRNYYFLYTTSGNPYNNKLTCNCGGFTWCFCVEYPCFGASREKWTEWAMVGGVCGTDLSDREYWGTTRDAQGMILHGNFDCHINLCDDEYSDWLNNEVDMAVAQAIWYKTGEYLATYIMDSEEVNRKTLLGVEQWNANRAFYTEKYVALINFIGENYEDERDECLKCKDPHGWNKRSQWL